MSFKKVLIPLDGSRIAENSLIYLDSLKSLGIDQVRLLSVVEDWEEEHGLTGGEALQRDLNLLGTYLREVSSDCEAHLGLKVETQVAVGSPAEVILDEIESFDPDLLVISTHGRSGPSRWRFGSVADKIIRSAPCPTLVVGARAFDRAKWLEARIMAPFKSIMVPLDGSALAEEALPVAKTFAEAYDSTLHLVRVISIPIVLYGLEGEYFTPTMFQEVADGAKEYLKGVAGRLKKRRVQTSVPVGVPVERLEAFIKDENVDLVVMTSHGRGGLLRAALGSVTDRLLGSEAPVLVVRPDGDAK